MTKGSQDLFSSYASRLHMVFFNLGEILPDVDFKSFSTLLDSKMIIDFDVIQTTQHNVGFLVQWRRSDVEFFTLTTKPGELSSLAEGTLPSPDYFNENTQGILDTLKILDLEENMGTMILSRDIGLGYLLTNLQIPYRMDTRLEDQGIYLFSIENQYFPQLINLPDPVITHKYVLMP